MKPIDQTVSDMNLNGQIDRNDTDRIVSNDTRYVSLNGSWWCESTSWQVRQNGSPELTLMGRSRARLTGLSQTGGGGVPPAQGIGILTSETHSLDPLGNETVSCTYLDRSTHTTTQTTLSPDSTLAAETVVQSGLTVSTRTLTGVTTTYDYDALGRPTAQTDGRGNTRRTVYDAQGRVAKTIDALGHETTYAYDPLNRQIAVTDPLDHTVTTTYDAEGRVLAQRGATYPVDYTYDEYGNKASMTTYRKEPDDGTQVGRDRRIAPLGDTTRWLYDEPSGCMTNKVYADGKGSTYSYTPDGKLARRTWARGIVTDYSYNNAGQLILTTYSDTTPTITMSYDRVGNMTEATTANVVTNLYAYNIYGNCTNEWQNDFNLTRYYDTFGRNTGYAINGNRQTVIGYDTYGRISTMSVPAAEEGENVHSTPTPTTYTSFNWTYLPNSDLKQSLTYPNGLTASWQYDANNQLLQVCNATPTNVISQFDYTYDAAGRRIAMTKSGSAMSQTDTIDYAYNSRSELTNALARADADYNYAYVYDDIGNRISSTERGTNTVYAANELNQYTAVDDFTPEFDDDGNQTLVKTTTGIWRVTYNGENRPVLWRRTSDNMRLKMSYDYKGRRREKNEQKFFYDGYLQVMDNDGNAYVWDPTEPIATRPLAWKHRNIAAYYVHDGNKNVSEVVLNNIVVAHYEYSCYGMPVAQQGVMALQNFWRFSSEMVLLDLGLTAYSYRDYAPQEGRWLYRDPVFENFAIALYLFTENNSVSLVDILGLGSSVTGYVDPSTYGFGNDGQCCCKLCMYSSFTKELYDSWYWERSNIDAWRGHTWLQIESCDTPGDQYVNVGEKEDLIYSFGPQNGDGANFFGEGDLGGFFDVSHYPVESNVTIKKCWALNKQLCRDAKARFSRPNKYPTHFNWLNYCTLTAMQEVFACGLIPPLGVSWMVFPCPNPHGMAHDLEAYGGARVLPMKRK